MSKNLYKLIIIFLLSNTLVFANLINGFYFSNKSNTSNSNQTSNASNLNGKNIYINTDEKLSTNTNVVGSNVIADENLYINTNNLNVKASQDNYTSKNDSESINGSIAFTMYGGGGGTAGLGYGKSDSSSDSFLNNNSQLSGNNVNINVKNDAVFQGANVRADDTLNLNVGNNLVLESLRDEYSSNSKGFNVNVGGSSTSVNGGFTMSNGVSQSKQTVLSSITGDKVNVNVGNNTHLKGSLLASGNYDENGNFVDNKNLNLTTDTLTFGNLSNSTYSSSKSLGANVNYNLGSKNDKNQDVQKGISSVGYQASNSLEVNASKTLATLGQGNVTVKDVENSDELDRLNRDTTAVNKDLYSSSTGTKVDATLDTRLLTEDGRNQIKDDMYTASAILKSIEQIASNDKVSILDFFDETQQNVDIYNAMKRKIASDENFASKLQDPNLDPLSKQNMLQEIALTVMKELGYVPNDVKLIYTDETGANGVQVKGFYDPNTQTSYVNDKNNNSTNELVSSTGHEIMHDVDKQNGIFVSNDKDQNIYATNFGNNLAYYVNGALYIVNGGSLSSTNNHNNGVVTQYPSVFNTNNVLSGNNKEFANINKSGGDDWVVQVIGGSIGGGSNIYSQYKRNGDSLNLKNINWTELGINIGTGAWSGGASSLGGAIVRGGIASGINETYNQVKYNKNGIDYSEIGKYSTIGVVTGGSVGLAGNLGNKIIISTGVIGRPVNEPIKTWKIPAEIGAGVSGAVVPNLKSNNDE